MTVGYEDPSEFCIYGVYITMSNSDYNDLVGELRKTKDWKELRSLELALDSATDATWEQALEASSKLAGLEAKVGDWVRKKAGAMTA